MSVQHALIITNKLVQTIVKMPHPLIWFYQFLCECNVICKLQY